MLLTFVQLHQGVEFAVRILLRIGRSIPAKQVDVQHKRNFDQVGNAFIKVARRSAVLGFAIYSNTASACPFCRSETSTKVRSAIFEQGFFNHFLAAIAPFVVLFGILIAVYLGLPASFSRLVKCSLGLQPDEDGELDEHTG